VPLGLVSGPKSRIPSEQPAIVLAYARAVERAVPTVVGNHCANNEAKAQNPRINASVFRDFQIPDLLIEQGLETSLDRGVFVYPYTLA
jgi:hypothetical protein